MRIHNLLTICIFCAALLGASAEIILSLSATEVARLSLTSENAELVSKLSAEQVSYPSVAVKLNEGNPVRFAAVNLTYLAESGSASFRGTPGGIVTIALPLKPPHRYLEQVLLYLHETLAPAVFLIHGGFGELGALETQKAGIDISAITVPIIHMSEAAYSEIDDIAVLLGGSVNVTITDIGDNPYRTLRASWVYPLIAVVLGVWELANVGLAIKVLFDAGCRRNMATLCLGLELSANLFRLLFAIDPFAQWFFPTVLSHVFLTCSFPLSISATILLTFSWHELVTFNSVEVSSVLGKGKYPAIICIAILFVFETISSSLRAAGVPDGVMVYITGIAYIIVLLAMVIYFCYVTVKVIRFLKKFQRLGRRQRTLRSFTIRAAVSAIGMLILIVGLILAASDIAITAVGEAVNVLIVHGAQNWISTAQIAAFYRMKKSGANSSTNKSTFTNSATTSHAA